MPKAPTEPSAALRGEMHISSGTVRFMLTCRLVRLAVITEPAYTPKEGVRRHHGS